MTILSSPHQQIQFGPGLPTLLINDQLRVIDQSPHILDQLSVGNLDGLLDLARQGQNLGVDAVDILVCHPDLDEVDLLPRIVARLLAEIGCPISLDTRNPIALEAALQEIQPYKALVNSVTAEDTSLETLLPLVKKYHAAVVGMPIGHIHGLPKTAVERITEAQVILNACDGMEIPREDVVLDAVCLASAAEPGSFRETMLTLQAYHNELGVATILGIGNAGFGMPASTVIDLAYLISGISWGLDSALVNPTTQGLVETVQATDFLVGRDVAGKRYIQNFRKKKALISQ
jgi:5-methyltetrahydrofolate--homocysteine methyltransferase